MRFNTNSKSVVTIGRFLLGRLFPLPFLIAGANVMFFGLRSMDRAKASTEWPSVRGVVVLSEVDSRGGHRGTSYFAEVLYDYEVDGAKHCSNRIGYGVTDTATLMKRARQSTVTRKAKKWMSFICPKNQRRAF